MTSGEKMSKGMSLFSEGLAETLSNIAKEFVKIWDKLKPSFNFLDKRITKKKFKKLLQSYGIQRNEINKIISSNKEPYTLKLLMKYIPKESE